MRVRSTMALCALAVGTLARPAAAATPARFEFAPGRSVSLFESIVTEGRMRDRIPGDALRTDEAADVADEATIDTRTKRDRRAIGAMFGAGLLAYFLLGPHDTGHLLVDPPAGGTVTPHNDGGSTAGDPLNPPVGIAVDTSTVTPEPGTVILLGTGLSSLGALARRRRRA